MTRPCNLRRWKKISSGLFFIVLFSALTACPGKPGASGPSSITEPESIKQARRLFRTSFADFYLQHLEERVSDAPIRAALAPGAPWPSLKWRSSLQTIYADREFQHLLTVNGIPSNAAVAFVQHAASADRHGLMASKYLRPSLGRYSRLAGESAGACSAVPIPTLTDQERAVVDEALRDAEAASSANVAEYVWDRLMSDPRAEDLHHAMQRQVQLRRSCAGWEAALELSLADALFDYVHDVRGFNWLRVNPSADDNEARTIVRTESRRLFEEIAGKEGLAEARDSLDALFPTKPQYLLLLEARERYEAYVDAGGFGEPVPERHVARGSSGSVVRALKRRLQLEGFYEGPVDDAFGRDLESAVSQYQETHQMEVTGESSNGFWASINTSAQDRFDQIELTLQRWRESRTLDDDYYVQINIPDFHAELWKDDELVRRFRIVVGNTQQECRNGRKEYVNATPVQSANMTYVVLNPYWNVPDRIVREELLPQLAEEPEYFESHGYETVTLENGHTMVRQLPGPGNALGRVKFIFPNSYDTYMHDTPKKGYFQYPVRAFSHGCMRVQDPMGLLETILSLDGQWDPDEVENIQEHGRERRISLSTPIAVHSEYFVVRVDEQGRTHFNADIYRMDRERLDPRYVRIERCTPAARSEDAREYVLSEDGTLMVRDENGALVDPATLNSEEGEIDVDIPIELPFDFGP